jgi:hypothetical protein
MKENGSVEPVAAAVDPPEDVVRAPVGLDDNQLAADRTVAAQNVHGRPERAIFMRRCSRYSRAKVP